MEIDVNSFNFNEEIIKAGPKQVAAEVIVAHRIGYWYPVDFSVDPPTEQEIQQADDLLEVYVQQRIAEANGN